MIRADEIKEGMFLDLEGDKYANSFNEDEMRHLFTDEEIEELRAHHRSIMKMYQHEFCLVENVERETDWCVRIDTVNASFGCPPDHMIKCVNPFANANMN